MLETTQEGAVRTPDFWEMPVQDVDAEPARLINIVGAARCWDVARLDELVRAGTTGSDAAGALRSYADEFDPEIIAVLETWGAATGAARAA